ncbi:hypothetical protein VD0002_g1335 [Verticillium dahliae]|uniref:Uncharacterized protein n=1 Tax=Verticillium dahliae TaxID=27337 RepID=A0AA45ARK1_VERDA|nr:hypothetical protein BJF96_g419 [Verticillium dahliae]PNH45589.1 hypothetical protein VD0004_g2321 [Verticillium dahliae]PNH50658.1 hypothetical protein VD0003_g6531 [Verticillium dahliae]PNH68859.1 hypothetical protein VD0002_g1335 [Verticillium dahliae]PNH75020.1 hypothetical protein VD0001_g2547 [Verticillium dahliae]
MLYLVFLSMRWKTLLYLALVDPDTTHLIANVTLDDALAYGKNIECGPQNSSFLPKANHRFFADSWY